MYIRKENDCIPCQVCNNIPSSIFINRQGNQKCSICLDDDETIYVKNNIIGKPINRTWIECNFMSMEEFKDQDLDWQLHLK